MFLMFNNIWNERVFRTVLKLPLKPLLLFLFFFFFLYAPGNVFDGLAFRMFSGLYQSSNLCYDKRSEKKKKKKKTTKIEGTENIHHLRPVIFELPFMKFWRHVNLAILIN